MLIRVRVFPNSKKGEFCKKSGNKFEVKVREKAERGLANKGAIKILSLYFNIPESGIRLIKGFKQSNKIFEVLLK